MAGWTGAPRTDPTGANPARWPYLEARGDMVNPCHRGVGFSMPIGLSYPPHALRGVGGACRPSPKGTDTLALVFKGKSLIRVRETVVKSVPLAAVHT